MMFLNGKSIVVIYALRFRGIKNYVEDAKLYLYDILQTKKETSKPLEL